MAAASAFQGFRALPSWHAARVGDEVMSPFSKRSVAALWSFFISTALSPLLLGACGNATTGATDAGRPSADAEILDMGTQLPDGSPDVVAHDGSSSEASEGDPGCTGATPACHGSSANGCCTHDPVDASCVNGQWVCGTALPPGCDGIFCGTPACEPTAPTSGTPCNLNGPNYVCSYEQGCEQCECSSPAGSPLWSCTSVCADGGAAPCSLAAPEAGSGCSQDGIVCNYTSGDDAQACTCQAASGWSCGPMPYPDGGVAH
jgi:hypothetical protein